MKKDLQDIFEEKKIENEFENKDPIKLFGPDGVMRSKEQLIKEYNYVRNKLKACDREFDLLSQRIKKIQHNVVDDMRLRWYDPTNPKYNPKSNSDAWHSSEQRIRDKFKVWDIKSDFLNLPEPYLEEVSMRVANNEKYIPVIDKICRRMDELNNWVAKNAYARAKDLKQELSQTYDHEIRDGI